MSKTIVASIFLLFSSVASSEADFDAKNNDNTYLFTAPGTVTGQSKSSEGDVNSAIPTLPSKTQDKRPPLNRYKYVGESTKFRQFGQKPSKSNPWFEEYKPNYQSPMAPPNRQAITNPWQLGGMPSFKGMQNNQAEAYSYNRPPSPYVRDSYMPSNNFFPDFPVGIYRDTNPAANSSMPGNMNGMGMMPGMSGNDFDFPFSPFGMF